MKDILLGRKTILGISLFEFLVFLFTIIIGTTLTFVQSSVSKWYDWVFLIDIYIGIIAALALAKKFKYANILLMLDAILYGSGLIGQQNYATGIINVVLIPIIMIVSIGLWKNQKQEIETKKINLIQGISITLLITALTTAFAFLMIGVIDTSRSEFAIWLDAFASVITIFAFLCSALRYRETWFFFIVNNIVKIGLFSYLIAINDPTVSILSLILAIAYLINAVYGVIVWTIKKHST